MIADVAPAPLQESPVSSISKMRVEVFLDLICPRSYITVSRLCDALERFEHRFEVEVVWRGFQLDPTDGRSFEELLADNVSVNWQMEYVDAIDVAREAHARIAQAAIQDGLRYDSLAAGPVDTFAAHRMLHLAAGYGLTDLAVRRIQRAYFGEGSSIDDLETLVDLIAGIGVDQDEARAVAFGDAYAQSVFEDRDRAERCGICTVPTLLIDDSFAQSGTQSVRWLLSVLRHRWNAKLVPKERCETARPEGR